MTHPPPTGPAIGSLCTGYGGLDMAVQQVLGGHLAWIADPDPGASAILAHHHPDVPNLGDITALDWAAVQGVDVLVGGYPCQPFSVAGLRKGTADDRHIWPYIATALRVLRPQLAVFENVPGHLRLGFDTVLADLAALGFDAEWCTLRADEVGAPHRRERLWIVAWPADIEGPRLPGEGSGNVAAADAAYLGHHGAGRARDGRPGPADGRHAVADADGGRRRPAEHDVRPGEPDAARGASADAPSVGRGEGRAEPARQQGGPGVASGRGAAVADAEGFRDAHRAVGDHRVQLVPEPRPGHRADAGDHAPGTGGDYPAAVMDWGRYAPAIHRWESVMGTPAPGPVNERGRLAPAFVEWLMGLPAGHVTAVPGLSRTRQLKALGNGVVPLQGAAALRLLLDRTTPDTPAA